jgi:hypothetical protein
MNSLSWGWIPRPLDFKHDLQAGDAAANRVSFGVTAVLIVTHFGNYVVRRGNVDDAGLEKSFCSFPKAQLTSLAARLQWH